MWRYSHMAGLLVGLAMLTVTARPGAAWPTFSAGTALRQSLPASVLPVRAGTGHVSRNRNVNRNTSVNRNVNRNTNVNVRRNTSVNVNVGRRPVRVWAPRPYYGTVVAGVALGTMIVVASAGAAPSAPSSTLCWYWSDPAMLSGYWDYCK
jgi:hypothetical protein